MEFYYTSFFFTIIFFLPPPLIAEMDIRDVLLREKAAHSSWDFYLLLQICQLFKHGAALSVPMRGVCVSALTLENTTCALPTAKARAELHDALCLQQPCSKACLPTQKMFLKIRSFSVRTGLSAQELVCLDPYLNGLSKLLLFSFFLRYRKCYRYI